MPIEYTDYDGAELASPPLDLYSENWKRLILLSGAAYTEVGAERGITLPALGAGFIICGPLGTLAARSMAIETIIGEEPTPKSNFAQERIQTDFVVRSGGGDSPAEQIKRCSADNEVIKRVIRKILGSYVHELTQGWPANNDGRYVPPQFQFVSIQQFPMAQEQEPKLGYSGGVRLNLLATYHQIL